MYELCIKLELINELYYDARPNKSQDLQYGCIVAVTLCATVSRHLQYGCTVAVTLCATVSRHLQYGCTVAVTLCATVSRL